MKEDAKKRDVGKAMVKTVEKIRATRKEQEPKLAELARQGHLMSRGVDPKEVSRPVRKSVAIVIDVERLGRTVKRRTWREQVVAVILKDGSGVELNPPMSIEEWCGGEA
jgi:hypothetical protein